MSSCCFRRKCRKIQPHEEQGVMTKAFMVFLVIQTITLGILCGITVYALLAVNFDWFLPFDLLTLIIAVIILSILILVTGIASAVSNTVLAWMLFHAFMGVLLVVEILTSWFSSDVGGFLVLAESTWRQAIETDISELQDDLMCCGFENITDHPATVMCQNDYTQCCRDKLHGIMLTIRNTASVAMFVDFVFAMFIDFAGCAICFHPDTVTLDEQMKEDDAAMGTEHISELMLNSLYSTDVTARRRKNV